MLVVLFGPSSVVGTVLADPANTADAYGNNNNNNNTTAASDKSNQNESEEGMPAKCNRASSLIGMSVRNQNDEHLGKIKDVVFDFKNRLYS